MKVLVHEENPQMREALARYIKDLGYESITSATLQETDRLLREDDPHIILVSGDEIPNRWFQKFFEKYPEKKLIAYGENFDKAISLLKMGALDYLKKPIPLNDLKEALTRARKEITLFKNSQKYRELTRLRRPEIVGKSETWKKILETAEKVAETDIPVLITGETGTGKDVLARYIHWRSLRRNGPFIAVNCSAIPPTLLEAELFGYEKGAFTGAYTSKMGKIELADGGTLFLDEIGELPLELQPKLLRVLETGEINPIGSNKVKKVNFRLISATNRNLIEMINKGLFREDLYYRINGIEIHIPPLRERKEDIEELARYYWKEYALKYGKNEEIPRELLDLLKEHPLTGNVRQLKNILERAAILGEIPQQLLKEKPDKGGNIIIKIGTPLKEAEKKIILETLKANNYNRSRTAKVLGIGLRTLQRKLKEWNLSESQKTPEQQKS